MENSTSAKVIDGQKRSASPTVSIQIRKENDERFERLQEELNTLKTMMEASLEQNTNNSMQAGHGFQATTIWMHASDTELLYFLLNWDRHELEPCLRLTSRDRPKSAPYPRLKNSKKNSKCQVLFYSTRKSKIFEIFFSKKLHTQKNGPSGAPGLASASPWRAKVSQCRKTERVDPLRFFNIHSVAKHEKIEENKNFHFREKISQCRKKTERGDPLGFFNIHSVAKHQKNAGGTV